jgi:hypothetical protein
MARAGFGLTEGAAKDKTAGQSGGHHVFRNH